MPPPILLIGPPWCSGRPPAHAKVQRTAFDEPNTNPQPPDTLQVSVPICTLPWAAAGVPLPMMPVARPNTPAAKPDNLYISVFLPLKVAIRTHYITRQGRT